MNEMLLTSTVAFWAIYATVWALKDRSQRLREECHQLAKWFPE